MQNKTNNNKTKIYLFEPATFGINTGLQALWEVVHHLDQGLQSDLVPSLFQRSFKRFDIRVGFLARFFLKNRPDCVVHRVKVRAVRWPFASRVAPVRVDRDHIWAVGPEPVLKSDTPSFLASFRVEFALVLGFRLIIVLARRIFFLLLAVFSRFRFALLPVSSNLLIASRTACRLIPRSSAIFFLLSPFSCIRIIAGRNSEVLNSIFTLKNTKFKTNLC